MIVQAKGDLTDAILAAVREAPIVRTATEVAHTIEHAPAVVSGILARLHKQARVERGCVEGGPWRYAHYRARLENGGFTVQPADHRPMGDE